MSNAKSGIEKDCNCDSRSGVRSIARSLDTASFHANWYAVWTRSRQEKAAAKLLEGLNIQHFLPLKSELRQWSDRKQTVATPLFTGYLFVRMNLAQDSRLPVLRIPGIAGFVGNSAGPLPIPELQIESIRAVLSRQADCTVLPLLHEGERVRVVRGVLAGVEGRLVRNQSSSRLILSVELIHKSLVVSVSPRDVEPLDRQVA